MINKSTTAENYPLLVKLNEISKEYKNLPEIEELKFYNNSIEIAKKKNANVNLEVLANYWQQSLIEFIKFLNKLQENNIYLKYLLQDDLELIENNFVLRSYQNLTVKQEEAITNEKIMRVISNFIKDENLYEFNNFVQKLSKVKDSDYEEILKVLLDYDYKLLPAQLEQIRDGHEAGLSDEKIKIYAKSEFNARQMGVIKHALIEDLPLSQIELFAISEFSSRQMYQIKSGFVNGLTINEVKAYANFKVPVWDMVLIRLGLEKKRNLQEIKANLAKYYQLIDRTYFGVGQINKIKRCFYLELPFYKIEVIANPKLTVEEMEKLIKLFYLEENNIIIYDFVIKTKNLVKLWDFYGEILKYPKHLTSTETKYVYVNDQRYLIFEQANHDTKNLELSIRLNSVDEIDRLFKKLAKRFIVKTPKQIKERLYGGYLQDPIGNVIFVYMF